MSRLRLLAATAALLVAASGALAAASPADAASRPQVGQCRTTTFLQGFSCSDTTRPVPCSRRHTMKTFAVANIPSGIDYVHVTAAKFTSLGRSICTQRFWRALSATHVIRAQSVYGYSFFGPTKSERTAGARWLRCDLAMYATAPGGSTVLAPLPNLPFPVIGARRITDSTRRCLSDATHFYWTPCSRAHAARADRAFVIATAVRPSQGTIDATASTKCPGERTSKPSPYEWKLGNHAITCYTATTH